MDKDLWNELFEVIETAERTEPTAKTLDPIAELMAKPKVQIPYKRRIKQNAKIAFMEMSKKHLNWLKLLLEEFKWTSISAERTVLLKQAPVKRGIGRGTRGQMWEEFVAELYQDKAIGCNHYSEGQLRHLPTLLAEIAAVSFRFKGAGTLEFIDTDSGELLV